LHIDKERTIRNENREYNKMWGLLLSESQYQPDLGHT
jgi:hypothetical protein